MTGLRATVSSIVSIRAREILDSRGAWTLEVDVVLSDGSRGRAAVPSGGSRGRHEARHAADVRAAIPGSAVAVIDRIIAPVLQGADVTDQVAIDGALLAADGTPDKSRLGADCMLGVSIAAARAAARAKEVPLHVHLATGALPLLPLPMFDVLNGGAHADNGLLIEEFMVVPVGATSLSEAIRWGAECLAALRDVLQAAGHRTVVGDQGGFAPGLDEDMEALELVLDAIRLVGLRPGKEMVLALDAAASSFYDGETYESPLRRRTRHDSAELVGLWTSWARAYPLWSIEDGMAESDLEGWTLLTRALGEEIVLVGDDLFATDPDVISGAVIERIGNAVLVKPDQIGTVTEALEAIEEARAGWFTTIVSGRAGDTTDDFVADFAVATAAGAIKAGAPSRGERVAKYNQLLRIEEELGAEARFAGPGGLPKPGLRGKPWT